ncbi:MAG: alpha/beta hydrolase family protein [Alphaproteobacteria bacterium]
MKTTQFLASALVAATFAASAQDAPAPAAPKALETAGAMFGVRESVEHIDISPSGTRVVYISPGKGRISSAYVADLAGGPHRLVVQTPGVPDRLQWCKFVTDKRLICKAAGVTDVGGVLVGFSRLMAVDDDGQNMKLMGQKGSEFDSRLRQNDGEFLDWLPAEEGAVLMSRDYVPEEGKGTSIRLVRKTDGLGVDRIDVNTMKASKVEGANKLADFYMTDGRGRVRMKGYQPKRGGIEEQLSTRHVFQYRLANSDEWLDFSSYDGGVGMWPLAIDADSNAAYVLKALDGRDALYRVKLDGSLAAELVYKHDRVDIDDVVRTDDGGRVIGVTYVDDKRHVVYFDPEFDRLSRALGKAIPKLPQVAFLGSSKDGGTLLLRAGSDSDPGRYFVFNKATKNLNEIMLERPALENVVLSTVKAMTYAAADGTMIPAYLTLPPGKTDAKGLPAVVMPHGGPSARDEWGFDWLAQFLAHQGYAVLQPNYRGSAGYGEAWMVENGFRSWRTSIGDVTSAGKWLLTQGADPARLSIVGWSYGGYAALQSAVTEPALFHSVVAIAPVTDLALWKKEAADYTNQTIVEEFVGDGPHVVEGSPLQNVARIQVPVLMFHGTMDANVEVEQSRKMDAALKAAGKKSELLTIEGLEHSLVDSNVRAYMLDRIDAFLKAAPAN